MTQITKFDPANLKAIRTDMSEALAKIEAEYGIKISIGKISYNANEFSAKITSVINNATEETSDVPYKVDAKWKSDFLKTAWQFGYSAEDFGSVVKVRGKEYYIVGGKPRKPNFILQEVGTPNCFDVPVSHIQRDSK